MKTGQITITAPLLGSSDFNETQVFGAVVWLWMQDEHQSNMPLHALSQYLMPVLKHRQFIVAYEYDGQLHKPVAYLAWANMSAEAESRYVHSSTNALLPIDWTSGDRIWFTHWFTPFGHAAAFRRVVAQLWPTVCARALYHRGNERGLRVLTFRGQAVS